MKTALITLLCLISSGCYAQQIDLSNIHHDTLITCKSKLDGSELDYLKSQRTDVQSTLFQKFTISNITDVKGVKHSVNTAEWTNFVCQTKDLP